VFLQIYFWGLKCKIGHSDCGKDKKELEELEKKR